MADDQSADPGPIDDKDMDALARLLEVMLNGSTRGPPNRQFGFILGVFELNAPTLFNYICRSCDRTALVKSLQAIVVAIETEPAG